MGVQCGISKVGQCSTTEADWTVTGDYRWSKAASLTVLTVVQSNPGGARANNCRTEREQQGESSEQSSEDAGLALVVVGQWGLLPPHHPGSSPGLSQPTEGSLSEEREL